MRHADRPILTAALVAAALLLFVLGYGPAGTLPAVEHLGVNGSRVAAGEGYRLLTAAFVHIDPVHLVMNLWALWLLGAVVESLLGRLRFLAVYLMGGLLGSAASALLNPPQVVSAGASGAILGLLGYLAAARLAMPSSLPESLSRWVWVSLGLQVGWSISAMGWVDAWGHAGGLVGGMLSFWVVGEPPHARLPERARQRVLRLARSLTAGLLWAWAVSVPLGVLGWGSTSGVGLGEVASRLPVVGESLPAVLGQPQTWAFVFSGSMMGLVMGLIRPGFVGLTARRAVVIVFGFLSLGALSLVGVTARAPLVVDRASIISPTEANEVVLSGSVRPGTVLRINGQDRTDSANEAGRFRVRYPLRVGRNEITLAVHRYAQGKADRQVVLVVERVLPAVSLTLAEPQWREVYQDRVVVTGRTAPGARLKVQGAQTPSPDAAGRFRLTVQTTTEGTHDVVVTATKPGYRDNSVTLTLVRRLTDEQRRARFEAEAVKVPFRELARNTERYVGRKVHYQGKVTYAMDDGRTQALLVSVTPTTWGWDDAVWVDALDASAPRILQGDIVDVLGEVQGRHTYRAVLGQQVTLPRLAGRHIQVLGEDS